jgi:hypothetical protein
LRDIHSAMVALSPIPKIESQSSEWRAVGAQRWERRDKSLPTSKRLRADWEWNMVKQAMEFACPRCGETAFGLMTPTETM